MTIIQDESNAKVEAVCIETKIARTFGLCVKNRNGEQLIEFHQSTFMTITNTLFKHHLRRLFTWILLNREYKNQINYYLITLRWVSSIENMKTRPEADCGSDYQLLVVKLQICLKTNKRHQQKPSQCINGKNEWETFGTIFQQKIRQEQT